MATNDILTIDIIKEGYSRIESDAVLRANGTCTLIRDKSLNIIVDTLTAWDRDFLINELQKRGLECENISHVVCTHGHSDHVGNLNLFTKAIHIIGQCVSYEDKYELQHFEKDMPYVISNTVKVLPTPGHTLSDVSVVVNCPTRGVVVVAGDLFEREEDILDPNLWKEVAGSENPELQFKNRNHVLSLANYIIPGHGPMFKVTKEMIHAHNLQCNSQS